MSELAHVIALPRRLELATDDTSWARFQRYFRVIGAPSRFIRRQVMFEIDPKR